MDTSNGKAGEIGYGVEDREEREKILSQNRQEKERPVAAAAAVDNSTNLSVERIFESQAVPAWRDQLTWRAFGVSLVLSVLFCFIVMKLNLTTGIIPSLNVSAGLLGFFFIKTWTKLLTRAGLLRLPFTRQENTVIQTCVVASSGIAFSGNAPFSDNSSLPPSLHRRIINSFLRQTKIIIIINSLT